MTLMLDQLARWARARHAHRPRHAHRGARRVVARLLALAATAGTAVVVGGPPSPADAQIGCAAVEIVTARGTWEPQNSSYLLSQVANRVRQGLVGVNVATYDVVYPAQPSFNTSAPQGVTNLVNHLNTEAQQCPNQRYILMGYSQGGLVVVDSLLNTGRAYGGTGTLSSAAASRIAAIGNFGSMRFTAGMPYNAGTPEAGRQSLLPLQPGALSAYADKMMDYCYNDDWVCQGDGSFLTHLWYIFDGTAQQAVATFVVNEYRSTS
jgi:pimeloyl-ACP methyl ester carboxylesterase